MSNLTLPIEIGKAYVRRDGKIVTAREPHPGFSCVAYVGNGDVPTYKGQEHVWLRTGRVGSPNLIHSLDLVADAAVGGSPESTEHQYAEVLRAIADGHRIQMQTEDGEWLRAPVDPHIVLLKVAKGVTPPSRFRIEQKPKTAMYRVAEMRRVDGRAYTETADEDYGLERSPNFIRWLTDWIEYEVTE